MSENYISNMVHPDFNSSSKYVVKLLRPWELEYSKVDWILAVQLKFVVKFCNLWELEFPKQTEHSGHVMMIISGWSNSNCECFELGSR